MKNAYSPSPCHTPGPWMVLNDWPGKLTIGGPKKQILAVVNEFGSQEINEANARLMAAAPDLLEACYAALELKCPDGDDHECGTFAVIRDAIAKAQGRA